MDDVCHTCDGLGEVACSDWAGTRISCPDCQGEKTDQRLPQLEARIAALEKRMASAEQLMVALHPEAC